MVNTTDTTSLLAEPSFHCSIHSTDVGLIPTNITLNLHPNTKMYRMLQYVYWKLQNWQSYGQLRDPSSPITDYCIKYNGRILPLDMSLREIEPFKNKNDVYLKLDFEINETRSGSAVNLDFDYDIDFGYANLDIQLNLFLSSSKGDPIITLFKPNVGLKTIGARLEKIALEDLQDLEMLNDNICSYRETHSTREFLGFKVKGTNTSTITLKDIDGIPDYTFLDSSLSELLGYDFLPSKSSKFTIMFYIHHKVELPPDYDELAHMTVHFISDIPLIYDRMRVTKFTTVSEVKDFIIKSCIIHPDKQVSPNDVKLIYRGKKILDTDLSNNAIFLMDHVNNNEAGINESNIHVQVASMGLSNVDPFWYEHFNWNKTPEESMQSLGNVISHLNEMLESNENLMNEIETNQLIREREAGLPSIDINDYEAAVNYKYVTESGLTIEPLGGSYTKCLIDGKDEVFIESRYLESYQSYMVFNKGDNHLRSMPVTSSSQFKVDGSGDYIDIDDVLITALEEELGMKIAPPHVNKRVESNRRERNWIGGRGDRRSLWRRMLRGGASFVWLLLRSIYLLMGGSLFLLFILFELAMIIPKKYTLLVILIYSIRTFIVKRELRAMWSDFLGLNYIDKGKFDKLENYLNSDSGRSDRFYEDLISHEEVIALFKSAELITTRYHIYDLFGIDYSNDRTEDECFKELIDKLKAREISDAAIEIMVKRVFNIYELINFGDIEGGDDEDDEDLERFSDVEFKKSMNDMFSLIKRDMDSKNMHEYPVYERFFLRVQEYYEIIEHMNVLRVLLDNVVPNPMTDNWIVGIIKNVVLFSLLLIPLVNEPVEEIIRERQAEIERNRRETATTATSTNDNNNTNDEAPVIVIPDTEEDTGSERTLAPGDGDHDVDEDIIEIDSDGNGPSPIRRSERVRNTARASEQHAVE